MLHEILLSLAGHVSPLLHADVQTGKHSGHDGLQFSSSERQLLAGIATLSAHHRDLKRHLRVIIQEHPSIICKAVATSLLQTHLRRFTNRILQVESSILRKDAGTVGAYDIVPLAFIVGQFSDWQRPLAWYWALSNFMQGDIDRQQCTGAALMNHLRIEAQTGFPDIERLAVELESVAEMAWLKQLATWTLHGKLNSLGATDFFIQSEVTADGQPTFRKHKTLAPRFVTDATARSILFIGRSLNHVQQAKHSHHERLAAKVNGLVVEHLELLTGVTLPISPSQLEQTVSRMRGSLSKKVLQDLLPVRTTRIALQCLQRYFLLSNSDFASCLLSQSERWRTERWESMDKLAQRDPVKALQGLSLRDAETARILTQTWKAMMTTTHQDQEDEVFEFAKKNLSLSVTRNPVSRPSTAESAAEHRPALASVVFNDLLLASPTSLVLKIMPPLDLLLSTLDIELYSSINAYLLALRRAQLHLEELWRANTARRYQSRALDMPLLRKGWATSSAVLLFLSELAAYLGKSVTQPACEHFQRWSCSMNASVGDEDDEPEATQKDPECIAAGHRAFLDALVHALLLTDMAYLKELRSLLGAVDQLTSLFTRWLDTNEGATVTGRETDQDRRVVQELEKGCQKVAAGRQSVVNRLREIHENSSGHMLWVGRDTGGYEPLRVGGLDQLLVKLDFEREYSTFEHE